jgi:hypothetical protein
MREIPIYMQATKGKTYQTTKESMTDGKIRIAGEQMGKKRRLPKKKSKTYSVTFPIMFF